ncbi:glycosyltransferase family 2 protein [Ornithinibacillus bavariensis]|uniref:glycosyltransferase family 2 protein n=1 Tax=Ornithinibacillus bavariensis TaxID=545502 RepID=UPI003D23EB34
MLISILIPCYNEEETLIDTYSHLTKVLSNDSKNKNYEYELIFINDGSRDDTLTLIETVANKDGKVKYISFSRNFGKEAAMLAGLKYSCGDAVIFIDADLQHPPELIPEMINYYMQGYDQVIAKRNRTGEKLIRKNISKLYYRLINKIVDVELIDGIGDFRLLSSRAVEALLSLPEYNRFSKGLFSWIGFKEKVISYENIERSAGESKWNFKSLINYGIDGILSFNNRPLRTIIYFGSIITLFGLLYIIYSFTSIMLFGIDQPGYFTTISAILLIGGIQLVCTGVIGEYIGRIYYEVKNRPKFIVQETNIKKTHSKNNSRTEMKRDVEKDISTTE